MMNKILFTSTIIASIFAGTQIFATETIKINNFTIVETQKHAEALHKIVKNKDNEYLPENLYTRISIDWPEKIGNYDLTKFHKTLINGNDADQVIREFCVNPESVCYIGERPIKYELVPATQTLAQIKENNYNDALFYSVEIEKIYLSNNFASYKKTYSTPGGAHNNLFSSTVNYDFANDRVIKFNDLFQADKKPQILKTLKDALCEKHNCEKFEDAAEREGIWANEFEVSKSFVFEKDQITFIYDPYYIGPWARGTVKISVPYYQIYNFLKPEYQKIINN